MKSLSSYELRQVAGGQYEEFEKFAKGLLVGGLTVGASAALSVGSVYAPGLIVMAMGSSAAYTGALRPLTPLLDAVYMYESNPAFASAIAKFNQTFA